MKHLKEIKRQINKEKYHNTKKLLKMAKKLEDNINWQNICANENISLDIIEDNLDLNCNWYGISSNLNLTINFIRKYMNQFK